MKRFINDYNRGEKLSLENRDEKKEYPIGKWVTTEVGSKKQDFLVSAYVYEDFVMFFYMYDVNRDTSCGEQKSELPQWKLPVTQRDLAMWSCDEEPFSTFGSYELNHLTSLGGGSTYCVPNPHEDAPPESEWDDSMKMYFGEYEYLLNLVKETDRVPEELKDKELAFRKDCFEFGKPIDEIHHIALYPHTHTFSTYFVGKSVTVPVGKCDIKVPYTMAKTGEPSYFIIKELELHNMLEDFERDYDILKENHEKAVKDYEENKDANISPEEESSLVHRYNLQGPTQRIMSLEEIRQSYDKTILILSVLMPEENRSLKFYSNEYLDSPIKNSISSVGVVLRVDKADERLEDDLYKTTCHVEGYMGVAKDEYEITLMSASDNFTIAKKPLFEIEF